MQMLHAVPADELVKALRKGVARNTPEQTHTAVQPAMEELARLLGALGRLREGAVMRVLGGSRRQLRLAQAGEFAALGLISGLVAAIASTVLAGVIALQVLELPWTPDPRRAATCTRRGVLILISPRLTRRATHLKRARRHHNHLWTPLTLPKQRIIRQGSRVHSDHRRPGRRRRAPRVHKRHRRDCDDHGWRFRLTQVGIWA
jgi:hypothetical protein